MSDRRAKLANFNKAMDRLREGSLKMDVLDDLARDGLIQRFEFTFELAWNTLKSCFEEEGLMWMDSPKTVLREAFLKVVNVRCWCGGRAGVFTHWAMFLLVLTHR